MNPTTIPEVWVSSHRPTLDRQQSRQSRRRGSRLRRFCAGSNTNERRLIKTLGAWAGLAGIEFVNHELEISLLDSA